MGETKVLVREHQDKVLALFRAGHRNLLFTTSVAEEGLDIQNCALVICYDVPNRPLSLVQTVGRARARNARVVFMEQVGSDGLAKAVSSFSPLLHTAQSPPVLKSVDWRLSRYLAMCGAVVGQ